MLYTPLGGAHEVGASCHLLQIADRNILIDSGLRPNRRGEESLPDLERLDALTHGRLDLILVSHAHIDHTGSLPLVHAQFPGIPTYCTPPTKAIVEILLQDTIRIMEMRQEEDASEFPLFQKEDVDRTLFSLREKPFDEWFEALEGVRAAFHRAGHIVGAAAVLIETAEAKVIYSGDISVASQRTVAGMTAIDFFEPDLLILEGTYGDGIHPSRKEQEQQLAKAVAEVVEAGGTVLVPSFALGRAQEIILILKSAMYSSVIPVFPIFVDGMVRAICDVYRDLSDYLPDKLRNYVQNSRQHVFWSRPKGRVPAVTRVFSRERITMFTSGPRCIISSSGMLVGGPSAYYAKVLAADKKNAIFITGYQDEESPGRRLLELQTGDTLRINDEDVPMNCQVSKYNLSAHADQIQLCQQVSYIKPKSIVLVHGDPGALRALRDKLIGKYVVHVPKNGDTLDPLSAPEWMSEAKRQFLDMEKRRFIGNVTTDEGGTTIRFGNNLAAHAAWQRDFEGRVQGEGKFSGSRIEIKAVEDEDKR
jgi:Cft2 family RNA processing exonuclease